MRHAIFTLGILFFAACGASPSTGLRHPPAPQTPPRRVVADEETDAAANADLAAELDSVAAPVPAPQPPALIGPPALSLSPAPLLEVCGFATRCRRRRTTQRESNVPLSLQGHVQVGGRSFAFQGPEQRRHPAHNTPDPGWTMVSAPGNHGLSALDAAIPHTVWENSHQAIVSHTEPPSAPIEGLRRESISLSGHRTIETFADRGGRIHALTRGFSNDLTPAAPDLHQYGYYDGEWHVSSLRDVVVAFGVSVEGQPWLVFSNGEVLIPAGTRRDLRAETGFDPNALQPPDSARVALHVDAAAGVFGDEQGSLLIGLNHQLVLVQIGPADMILHPVAISASLTTHYEGALRRVNRGRFASPRIPLSETYTPLEVGVSTEGLVLLYARDRSMGRIVCHEGPPTDQPGHYSFRGRTCWLESSGRHMFALFGRLLGPDGTLSEPVQLMPDQAGRAMAASYDDEGTLQVTVWPGFEQRRITTTQLSPGSSPRR